MPKVMEKLDGDALFDRAASAPRNYTTRFTNEVVEYAMLLSQCLSVRSNDTRTQHIWDRV